jgi:hypothetical protein
MNKQQNIEDRLWDYIDGFSSSEEKSLIDELLETNADWRDKYNELLEVHKLINSSELEGPSLRFAKNVMEEIAKYHIAPATKSYINKKIIWGIGGFFIAMIIGFLIYGFGQINWSAPGDSKLPIDLDKIDFSKVFNNTYMNIFMMINVVLALVLLDRYLTNRKNKIASEQ